MATTNILIISDSHGRTESIHRAIELTRPQLILFCGDGLRDVMYLNPPCPLYPVKGNCDSFLHGADEIDPEFILPVDGLRLFVTHGHRYDVKYGLEKLTERAAAVKADAAIFGHTHAPMEKYLPAGNPAETYGIDLKKPLYLFNPGSLASFRPSFGTLTIRDGVPLFGHNTTDG